MEELYTCARFWVECFATAVFLINRLPSHNLNMDSPFYTYYGRHPNHSTDHDVSMLSIPWRYTGQQMGTKVTSLCFYWTYIET